MVCPGCQTEAVEIFHRHLVALASAHALIEEWQFDILHGSLERDEVERLEDEAYHLVAVFCGTGLAEVAYQYVVEQIFARIIVVEDAEDIEQGRFA